MFRSEGFLWASSEDANQSRTLRAFSRAWEKQLHESVSPLRPPLHPDTVRALQAGSIAGLIAGITAGLVAGLGSRAGWYCYKTTALHKLFTPQKTKWKVCNYIAYLNQVVIQIGNLILRHEPLTGEEGSWCSAEASVPVLSPTFNLTQTKSY